MLIEVKKLVYHRVLTIAASDSGGGAGIQADLKTFAALGCYGLSVITALTAQNTVAVTAIHEVPADFVAKQIDAVLDDIHVDAVKIGMLRSVRIIQTVAERLRSRRVANIVVDPVMVSKSGRRLLRDNAIDVVRAKLLPLATVVTPNIPEASVLAAHKIRNRSDIEKAGMVLMSLGPKAVLIKGGHTQDSLCADCLCMSGSDGRVRVHWLESKRVITDNTHGTGCTLSSAIAAYLAKGYGVKEAVEKSKQYVTEAIEAGAAYELGKGHGPVHHFYELWRKR